MGFLNTGLKFELLGRSSFNWLEEILGVLDSPPKLLLWLKFGGSSGPISSSSSSSELSTSDFLCLCFFFFFLCFDFLDFLCFSFPTSSDETGSDSILSSGSSANDENI